MVLVESRCRACERAYTRRNYNANAEDRRQSRRQSYWENPEAAREATKRYRAEHPEVVARHNKKARPSGYWTEQSRRWTRANPEKAREFNRINAAKRRATPKGHLEALLRSAMHRGIRRGTKRSKTFDILGFTIDRLMAHLEAQFAPGMTWENHGAAWHIDHIRPLSSFNYETPQDAEFKAAWALTNLRPLWATDNLKKGAKIVSLL